MFDLGLVFHSKKFIDDTMVSLTYPKQSLKNYPYNITIFDSYDSIRSEAGTFIHDITFILKSSSSKDYDLSFEGSILDEDKKSHANQITKDIYDAILKHVLFNADKFTIKLNENKIEFDNKLRLKKKG